MDKVSVFVSAEVNFLAYAFEVCRRRIPKTTGQKDIVGFEVEVIPASQFGLGAVPRQSEMGFVGGFVFGKTHVTVNAKQLKTVYAIVLVELVFQGLAK